MSGSSPLNVVFVTVGELGHVIPMLHVADAVKKAGHNVSVLSQDFAAHKIKDRIEKIEAEFVPIPTGISEKEWNDFASNPARNSNMFVPLFELMSEPTKEIVSRVKPDVIVADFATLAGMEAAQQLEVPLIINLPGPVKLASTILGLADPQSYFQAGGIHIRCNYFSGFNFAMLMNVMRFGDWFGNALQHFANSKVLVHSFFGLEPPRDLPPNIKVVGPVAPSGEELGKRFQTDHPQLYEWLHATGAPPAVMITTGSIALLKDWQVRCIFDGVKKAGFRAVWSLKEAQQAFLPDKDDPAFWISSWLPQAELLQDDAVQVVITHCGWGGVLECLGGGKPVICMPFFGDQPENAAILVEAGCGELIGVFPATKKIGNWYQEGSFTGDSVSKLLKQVAQDPSYAKSVQKMKRAALACGGSEQCVKEIEWTARYGSENLVSNNLKRTYGGNPFRGVLTIAAAGGAAGVCSCFHGIGVACLGLVGLAGAAKVSLAKKASKEIKVEKPSDILAKFLQK
eukprot:gnl/MRDRNA2_/MRDRNA2_81837_c0_seq1.p1 gnl/MRDRNA2_/MRDRNA2_81837_c0~~gnl/MRDRNA2_/MRDRNA2_81837_c0_seq1.p1  ORF type:complete len:512 (-),score=106.44 gnl/MRDRNA2_/MRDRNA2_81837_c0_seq1:446-1981(-)